jgi:hypothetical protein
MAVNLKVLLTLGLIDIIELPTTTTKIFVVVIVNYPPPLYF